MTDITNAPRSTKPRRVQTRTLYRAVRILAEHYAHDGFDCVLDGISDTREKLVFLAAVRDAPDPFTMITIVAAQDAKNEAEARRAKR